MINHDNDKKKCRYNPDLADLAFFSSVNDEWQLTNAEEGYK